MIKKKWIIRGTAGVLVVALLGGGITYARKKATSGTVNVYPVSSVGFSEWGGNSTLWGEVTDSAMQEIHLGESLVEEVRARVGMQVKKGDVLLRYNKESVKLTIQADEARVALIEAEIESAKTESARLQSLRPSEEMPAPVEQVIHHKAEEVKTLSVIDTGTKPSEKGNIYYCTTDTKVTAAMLQLLDDNDVTAEFQMYDNNVMIGSWQLDGKKMSSGTKIIYIYQEKEVPGDTPSDHPSDPPSDQPSDPDEGQTPENPGSGTDSGSGSDSGKPEEGGAEAPGDQPVSETAASLAAYKVKTTLLKASSDSQDQGKEDRREEQGPYEDWILGEGLEFNGDGTVSVDYSIRQYGKLISLVPAEAEWDEYVVIDPAVDASGDNYCYSRKELAEMVADKSKEIKDKELELKEAQLQLKEDKLISSDGKVRASMDGVVTEVRDPSEVKSGDSLITVKGNSGFTVTAHVSEYDIAGVTLGEMVSVTSYETSNFFEAEVTEILLEPDEPGWYGNSSVTYYPIVCTCLDPELQLNRGEGCEVTRNLPEDQQSSGFYLPTMFVRKDDQGSYCMIADENNSLKKVNVKTGKTLWGSEVEIKEGISEEDRIAFPYGKNVNEGSPVVDKDNYYDEY